MAVKRAKYSTQEAEDKLAPVTFRHGRVRILSDVVTLASQANTDTIPIGKLPAGARILYGCVQTSRSLANARLDIGWAADKDALADGIAVTSTTEPVWFSKAVESDAALGEETEIIIDVQTASLPAAGVMVVSLFYVTD